LHLVGLLFNANKRQKLSAGQTSSTKFNKNPSDLTGGLFWSTVGVLSATSSCLADFRHITSLDLGYIIFIHDTIPVNPCGNELVLCFVDPASRYNRVK